MIKEEAGKEISLDLIKVFAKRLKAEHAGWAKKMALHISKKDGVRKTFNSVAVYNILYGSIKTQRMRRLFIICAAEILDDRDCEIEQVNKIINGV